MSFWATCSECGLKFIPKIRSSDSKTFCSFRCAKAAKPDRQTRDRPTTYRSRRQEKRTANEGGGRQVIASGALPGRKGDVRLDDWLVECKTTNSQSYRFKKSEWQQHSIDAALTGRKPMFEIDLDGEELIVLTRDEFFRLIKCE